MKVARLLLVVMTVVLSSGFLFLVSFSCKDDHPSEWKDVEVSSLDVMTEASRDTVATLPDQQRNVPTFVSRLLDQGEWYVDTILVQHGNTYCFAYDELNRLTVIYDANQILVLSSNMSISKESSDNDKKYRISVFDKSMTVDFSDAESVKRLASLTTTLPSFVSFRKDTLALFGRRVCFSLRVDYPKSTVINVVPICKWLEGKILETQQFPIATEEDSSFSGLFASCSRRNEKKGKDEAFIHDPHQVARKVSNMYFSSVKEEFVTNDEDFPSILFNVVDFKARVLNDRFVTYERYTNSYNGGMHGYHTEMLFSFDHVHRQEIDFDYLFKKRCKKEVLEILLDEAKKSPDYQDWKPDIMAYVGETDDADKLYFPQPGLSEEGVVFSFQPYDISCYAAGIFHFTIPYERIRHCLTERGRWCLGNSA